MRITLPFNADFRGFLPRKLFPRALLIIITPMVVLQAIVAWFFYERHWNSVSAHMAFGVAGEVALIIDQIERNPHPDQQRQLFDTARRNLSLHAEYLPGETLANATSRANFDESRFSLKDRMLARNLAGRLTYPFTIDSETQPRKFSVAVQMPAGVLRLTTRDERLYSLTINIFIFGMMGTSVLVLFIAILFLRNQVRPIRWLASAAEKFGKGQEAPDFRPSGAEEVRRAARNLLAMKQRLTRQMEQRSEMLAGVSHDLRSPLTRMKLQLAMLGESAEIEALRSDVSEMQRMVDDYLAFARGQEQEPAEPMDFARLVNEVGNAMRLQDVAIQVETLGDLQMIGRPDGLRRCLLNLVENSRRYAEHISIRAEKRVNQIFVQVDDDGPGIPADRRQDMFRPFRRMDDARGPDESGAGLGLTIARDVMRQHGADIRLLDAPGGGLRVELRIPV